MSNFIYYEKLEDYEEQVKKAKLCDEKDKEIERLNKFVRAFSDFIDDDEYWKQLGNNGEEIEIKVSHKWNELLKNIVYGSDKEC